MASFTKGLAAGNRLAFAWFIDDYGFPLGSSTSAPSQGATGSPAFNLEGIKTASPTIPEPEIVPVTGDDDLLAEFDFSATTARSFQIEYSVEDLNILSAILGTNVVTWGEAKVSMLDIPNPPERNIGLIFQSRAKKRNLGVSGQKGWNGTIIPLATLTPLGRASYDERGAAVFRMQVTPQQAQYDPVGITIAAANYGSSGGRYQTFFTENPITLHTWRGTGVVTQFTLQHRPITAAKTPVWSNRVAATTNSVSTTAPYSATVSAAPAGAAAAASVYEFDLFVAA